MKKHVIWPLVVYVVVCLIAVSLPASEGYNAFGWKLFVGQVYAVPALLIASVLSFVNYKKNVRSV